MDWSALLWKWYRFVRLSEVLFTKLDLFPVFLSILFGNEWKNRNGVFFLFKDWLLSFQPPMMIYVVLSVAAVVMKVVLFSSSDGCDSNKWHQYSTLYLLVCKSIINVLWFCILIIIVSWCLDHHHWKSLASAFPRLFRFFLVWIQTRAVWFPISVTSIGVSSKMLTVAAAANWRQYLA